MENNMMKTILLTEDDYLLRQSIRQLLIENGYHAVCASTKGEADQYLLGNRLPDLAIIDINLPDGNGYDICKNIREHSFIPIIFLTARDDEESIVKGLDMGADDYIVKPFRRAELLSRIHAHLRRQSVNAVCKEYSSGDIRVNVEKNRVEIHGELVDLRPVEYELLLLFLQNPMIILKRAFILDRMWDDGENFVESSTLTVQMSRLRSKLGNYEGKEYISTIRGFGYRWNYEVNIHTSGHSYHQQ